MGERAQRYVIFVGNAPENVQLEERKKWKEISIIIILKMISCVEGMWEDISRILFRWRVSSFLNLQITLTQLYMNYGNTEIEA
jgi:hypothetical protein